jgi:hypothetical protein
VVISVVGLCVFSQVFGLIVRHPFELAHGEVTLVMPSGLPNALQGVWKRWLAIGRTLLITG